MFVKQRRIKDISNACIDFKSIQLIHNRKRKKVPSSQPPKPGIMKCSELSSARIALHQLYVIQRAMIMC